MKNSTWCELEGLKRAVVWLEDVCGLTIDTIITDRNRQIAKWIREHLAKVKHFYDVWHIAKSKQLCINFHTSNMSRKWHYI